MIIVDESEPVGEIEPPFESRDVQIRRGLNVRDFYEMEEEIGRGKFGTVFKCREKVTGLRLAAKFVQAPKKADRINVEREVEIMKSLRNPRLIQLYDAFDDGKKEICLLLELIEGGELFERVIDDDFVLTERACAIFMRQICEGIQFIHLQHVLHLDMKPENILCLTREGNRIKLIDFGLARRYDPSKKLQVLFGTPEFVAPEVVNFDSIGYGTDMWSVGVIGYVLLSGLSPFMGETDVETMANVTIAKYDFDDEAFNDVSAEAKDFISKLLIKQISKRMTATESLRHPWLRPRPPLPKPLPPPPPTQQEQESSSNSSSPSPSPSPVPSPVPSPPKPSMSPKLSPPPRPSPPPKPILPAKPSPPPKPSLPSKPSPPPKPVTDVTPSVATKNQKSTTATDPTPGPNVNPVAIIAEQVKPSVPLPPASQITSLSPNKETRPLSPTSVYQTSVETKDILQVAKVNLRQFVERWNSHPNSPFQLSSESPRRTISLLISGSPTQLDDSPASLTGMSPSPPCSLPMSPIMTNQTTNVYDTELEFSRTSTETVSNERELLSQVNHTSVVESNSSITRKTIQSTVVNSSVEVAMEQTSSLLKSVKESLIRQIESGTAVRDRTGARVWERKSSGVINSPGPSLQNRRPNQAPLSTDIGHTTESNPIPTESQEPILQPPSEPVEPPSKPVDPVEVDSIEEWEVHPPVAAREFGFAKRHKTISSTMTLLKATQTVNETNSSFSLNNNSTAVIEMKSHKP